MNNIEEMKKKYQTGKYKLLKKVKHLTNGWEVDSFNPFIAYNGRDITEDNFRLIHKKHEDVLNAWLEDNDVDIEKEDGIAFTYVDNFIESYSENENYRLSIHERFFKNSCANEIEMPKPKQIDLNDTWCEDEKHIGKLLVDKNDNLTFFLGLSPKEDYILVGLCNKYQEWQKYSDFRLATKEEALSLVVSYE